MIFIIGLTLAFFLELLLLAKKKKNSADKILALWLFAIGLHLLIFFIRYENKTGFFPFLLGLDIPFPLLHGPFLFLYVSTITRQASTNAFILYVHFIPFVISLSFVIPFLLLPLDIKLLTFEKDGEGHEVFMLINFTAIVLSGFTYFIWSLLVLRKHRKNIEKEYANPENVNLNWLRYLIWGIGIIWIAVAFTDEIYIFTAVVLFVLLTAFMGIRQTEIFMEKKEQEGEGNQADQNNTESKTESVRYSKSGLTGEITARILRDLNKAMQEEKLYKESDLSLSLLAEKLNTFPNYLSQVINGQTGNNFYTYINNLRITEFKRLLELPENKNVKILSLAYDCGFNSKSSFNKYFKQATGQTPTEYFMQLESAE